MKLHNVRPSMMSGAISYTIFGVLSGILLILVPTDFLFCDECLGNEPENNEG